MKTSGFRCETKFGLLVFLGHPSGGAQSLKQRNPSKLVIKTSLEVYGV